MKTLDQIRNEPATFGAGGGDVISDTSNHKGPYHILKAQGGDAVIATGSLPVAWSGNLNGLTVSNGDSIVLAGMHDITLTSGTLLAYKLAPTPPVAATPAVS
jgi:hypothetical protein